MSADHIGKVVIIGGGIIGCSVAYHLTELGASCTVIERCSIACGASGKAGGFLARTWCDGGDGGPLARASFDLYKTYGEKLDFDYRAVDTLEVSVDENCTRKKSLCSAPSWLDKNTVLHTKSIGNVSNTAQVHPAKVTNGFIKAAQKKGCKLIIDQVIGVEFSPDDKTLICGVRISNNKVIPCDTLVLAMGAWTNVASQWFDCRIPQIGAERAHSILITPTQPVTAHVLFIDYNSKEKSRRQQIEVYPRPDGTVYLCGYNDNEPLPESADLIQPNMNSTEGLHKMAGHLSSHLKECKVDVHQACYLPVPPAGVPAIGKVPHCNGKLYMAAGHYCWGILNAPATGKGLAELIVNGHSSIDLSAFEPANFL